MCLLFLGFLPRGHCVLYYGKHAVCSELYDPSVVATRVNQESNSLLLFVFLKLSFWKLQYWNGASPVSSCSSFVHSACVKACETKCEKRFPALELRTEDNLKDACRKN